MGVSQLLGVRARAAFNKVYAHGLENGSSRMKQS